MHHGPGERIPKVNHHQLNPHSHTLTSRYINIPGSGDFIFDFKMDLTLPPPISQPKSLFYPLDPDRYTKPKLTLLHIPKKPTLYNDITLGIPVDEVNMMPELYNPEGNVQSNYFGLHSLRFTFNRGAV